MLEKCSNCDQAISDDARDCPYCNFRIKEYRLEQQVGTLKNIIKSWKIRGKKWEIKAHRIKDALADFIQ